MPAAVIALVALIAACASTPPMPSSGTSAATPGVDASGNPPTTIDSTLAPGTSASPSDSVPGSSTSSAAPPPGTPPPTLPPADAIARELATLGSLTVCVALVGAPAATLGEGNQVVGYNVAFADELGTRLGLLVVIQQPAFSELTTEIRSHACDVSVSSQNITAGRITQMNLIPYTQSKLGFPVVVAAGNPKKIATLDDLCGLAVSAANGTTSVDQVAGTGDYVGRGIDDTCVANGKPKIDLHSYPTELDAVQAVLDQTVSAYLGNANFVAQYPDALEDSPAALPSFKQGIAVALDHPTLTAAVNAAIGAMISDGTYVQILRQYLPSQSVDNFSIIE